MPDFLTEAVPDADAIAHIATQPAVTREVYDSLLPEIRARAITITGVENADAIAAVRDRIADLPDAAEWDDIKGDLVDALDPWLGDGAEARAELLLRTSGFQAYAVTNVRDLDANSDLFPFWQYDTADDANVRDTHAALHGLTLPKDSPFWKTHTPPWEFGCRCDVVGISAEEAAEIRAAEADAPPENRKLPQGEALRLIEEENRLVGKNGGTVDITPPSHPDRDGTEGYAFEPRSSLAPPPDWLAGRYPADLMDTFAAWAREMTVKGLAVDLWEWLGGDQILDS